MSLQFAKKGWNVLQPVDVKYGFDLTRPDDRKTVVDLVKKQRPRLVLVEWPCTFWGKMTQVNFRTLKRSEG